MTEKRQKSRSLCQESNSGLLVNTQSPFWVISSSVMFSYTVFSHILCLAARWTPVYWGGSVSSSRHTGYQACYLIRLTVHWRRWGILFRFPVICKVKRCRCDMTCIWHLGGWGGGGVPRPWATYSSSGYGPPDRHVGARARRVTIKRLIHFLYIRGKRLNLTFRQNRRLENTWGISRYTKTKTNVENVISGSHGGEYDVS
jgi:hypothetical protein